MSFVDNPVINSPFEEPRRHYQLNGEGQPTGIIGEGRRPSMQVVPVPAIRRRVKQGELDLAETPNTIKVNQLVNDIRDRVGAWRQTGYPGAGPETRREVRGLFCATANVAVPRGFQGSVRTRRPGGRWCCIGSHKVGRRLDSKRARQPICLPSQIVRGNAGEVSSIAEAAAVSCAPLQIRRQTGAHSPKSRQAPPLPLRSRSSSLGPRRIQPRRRSSGATGSQYLQPPLPTL